MLRLQALEVTDFGPYRGTQRYDFVPDAGVALLWGENGRGKTSFLNALRYALFGIVLGRGASRLDLATIGNREESNGTAVRGFKAVLTFTFGAHTYQLTRAYAPVDPTRPASTVADFHQRVSLIRDGDVLGPDERDRELQRLLPEQTARFFLFDAELLQEYEQLLTSSSDVGDKLKAAIERILGLPVLTHARDDVALALQRARSAQAKAAQRDRATRELGHSLQLAQEEAEQARSNVDELGRLADELQASVLELEKDLASVSRFQKRLTARNAKREEVSRLQRRCDEQVEELQARSGEVWRAVLAPKVEVTLTHLETQFEDLQGRRRTSLVAEQVALAAASGRCPICRQPVSAATASRLRVDGATSGPDALDAELAEVQGRVRVLRKLRGEPALIARLEQAVDEARVALSDAEGQLRELDGDLQDSPVGEESLTRKVGQLTSTSTSLTNTRGRLADARADLQRKDQAVAALSDRLRQKGGGSTGDEDRKVALLSRLRELLEAAVTDFRERLRDRVEDEATAVFRVLSGEPDYQRLRINDNYGLTILYADGTPVINRSSGYEHVVALSLIAALQRCSPMSGPIITDSPFGRLDGTHKRHVLRALPEITEQVLLLVHDEELDRTAALNQLADHLVDEHHLQRITGRHTDIRPGAPA